MEILWQQITQGTIDPNIVYLTLLAGLWMGVTAGYIAGTGIAEAVSLVLLVVALAMLSAMPTNWFAVALLLLGVSVFLILPLFFTQYATWAESGLVLQAIGGVLLFDGFGVSPILIGLTIALAWAYNRFLLVPLLQNQHSETDYDRSNQVVGLRGRVVKELNPVGTVYVNGELWTARSRDEIPSDTWVIVTDQKGLELTVEKAKRVQEERFAQNGSH